MSTTVATPGVEIPVIEKIDKLNLQADILKEATRTKRLDLNKHFADLYKVLATYDEEEDFIYVSAEEEKAIY